jgi:LuxR family transcriptional regulator, maltose regulon positive regulatory protein
MTGQPFATPILRSKLYPATGTRSPLPRPRLDGLAEVLEGSYPVVLVGAPAGYGKSTLMARWHAQLVEQGIGCAWLSVDENDNDRVRFVRHLVAALRNADARFGQAVAGSLSGDISSGVRPLLEALAEDLASVQQRIALFLDDLHSVQEPEVLEIVDWLANYAPKPLQQIIGTRDTQRLRVSGLRVRRQLFELDLRQLQFDVEEVSHFYRDRLGQDLPARDLQRVLLKTEGWPAGLELVALALVGLTDQSSFIERFAGSDSGLVDYLGEVVLLRMDERTRAFVFRISMFDRICVPLAQAIGAEDAEEQLQALRMRNLFLIPLDQAGTWARFHHLVGEYFRGHYQRTSLEQATQCLVRGARWLHANDYIEEAVNCMIRAGDWEQATRWIAESLEELVFRRGYHQTILRWMNALPEAWVDRYPVIRIQYAFALSFYARYQEYEGQIHCLQQQLSRLESQLHGDAGAITELRCAVELLTAMSTGLRDEGKRGGELAAAWLARWPEESLRRKGVMGNVLAFGLKTTGEIGRGLEAIAETRRWLEQGEGYYALSWTAYLEGVLQLKRGSYLEAKLACGIGLELVQRELQGHRGQASMLHALLAGIAYEFNDIGQAVEYVEQAMRSVDECSHADAVIVAYLTQARLQRLRHDESSATAILRQGQELGQQRGLLRVTVTLAAEECAGLARAGRDDEARLVATRYGFNELPTDRTVSDLMTDKALRAASRYLARQSSKSVIKALGSAIERSRQNGMAHRQVELLLLRAFAFKQEAEWTSALIDLRNALIVAAPRQYVRVFLDEVGELASLMDRLEPESLRGTEAGPLARQLRVAMRGPESQRDPPASMNMPEDLTKRELSILRRLESGLSNKEIAESIFVTEGTLKWHLHNAYSKLNVRHRSAAVARARTLGIL